MTAVDGRCQLLAAGGLYWLSRIPVDGTYLADVLPVFSPDGKWLMWTSKRTAEKTSQVWAARFHFPKGS